MAMGPRTRTSLGSRRARARSRASASEGRFNRSPTRNDSTATLTRTPPPPRRARALRRPAPSRASLHGAGGFELGQKRALERQRHEARSVARRAVVVAAAVLASDPHRRHGRPPRHAPELRAQGVALGPRIVEPDVLDLGARHRERLERFLRERARVPREHDERRRADDLLDLGARGAAVVLAGERVGDALLKVVALRHAPLEHADRCGQTVEEAALGGHARRRPRHRPDRSAGRRHNESGGGGPHEHDGEGADAHGDARYSPRRRARGIVHGGEHARHVNSGAVLWHS